MRGLLLDIDGTTLLGPAPLPGARELVAALRRRRIPFLWLTNNTSRSRAQWLERLDGAGLAPREEELYTAGDATIDHLRARGAVRGVHLLGTPALQADFLACGIELVGSGASPARVVLGYDTGLTYARLCAVVHLLRAGLPYLATHPDPTCPTPDGPVPDVGSFIALLEVATGRRPEVVGKPQPTMMNGALARLGLEARDVLLVGDRLATDVRMANAAGARSALVLTGVTAKDDLEAAADRPGSVHGSLAELLPAVEGTWPGG